MSRTTVVFNFTSDFEVTIAAPSGEDHSYRGTDWGGTVPDELGLASNAQNTALGSIGDPAALEGAHWGWIYFRADQVNGGESFYGQVFISIASNLGDTAVFKCSISSYDPKHNEYFFPDSLGTAEVVKRPPGGTVMYTLKNAPRGIAGPASQA